MRDFSFNVGSVYTWLQDRDRDLGFLDSCVDFDMRGQCLGRLLKILALDIDCASCGDADESVRSHHLLKRYALVFQIDADALAAFKLKDRRSAGIPKRLRAPGDR